MFEEEEFLCISEHGNNNKSISALSASSFKNITSVKKSSIDQLNCHKIEERSPKQSLKCKKQSNRGSNFESNIEKETTYPINNNNNNAILATETPTVTHCCCAKVLNKYKGHKTDEKIHSNARCNIKRLKEMIASRRKHFFQANSSSISSYQTSSKYT